MLSSGGSDLGGPLSKASSIARKDFNRWNMVLPPVLTHLSIGGLYAWSMLNEPLSRTLGVVASVPGDWGISTIVPVFSVAVCTAGATAALSGKWSEHVGPRQCVALAGTLWGGGLALGGLGVAMHQLPLLYFGYGLVGGMGIGFAYGPPVATLLKWFPDKKGLASGMVIMGFGSGALVALPLLKTITEYNFVAPHYFGSADLVATHVLEGGVRVLASHPDIKVVVASTLDISKLGLSNLVLEPGVYAIGGSTGVAMAMACLGLTYSLAMWLAALNYRLPNPEWVAPHVVVSPKTAAKSIAADDEHSLILPAGHYVCAEDALRSRQFAQIWTSLFLNATCGIAVLGVAKTLMSDVFGSTNTLVDASFCAAYVGALSLFNGAGRLAWASASDRFGRKQVFTTFFALGIPLYLSVPYCAHMAGTSASTLPLMVFTSSTLVIISMYGGAFSVAPAYLADSFGSKEVGNIYGKLLTAWSMAGLVGPTLLATLRRQSEVQALRELSLQVDPLQFEHMFGSPIQELDKLITTNSVTIPKLLQLSDAMVDPTPFLYDTTMQTMAVLLAIGFVNNFMMTPVNRNVVQREGGVIVAAAVGATTKNAVKI